MVGHNKTFNLTGGKTFSTLKGFAKELKNMSKDKFEYHVSKEKNDFSNWIKHSMKNPNLAGRVEKSLCKIETELEILRHIVHSKATAAKKSIVKTAPKKAKTKAKNKK